MSKSQKELCAVLSTISVCLLACSIWHLYVYLKTQSNLLTGVISLKVIMIPLFVVASMALSMLIFTNADGRRCIIASKYIFAISFILTIILVVLDKFDAGPYASYWASIWFFWIPYGSYQCVKYRTLTDTTIIFLAVILLLFPIVFWLLGASHSFALFIMSLGFLGIITFVFAEQKKLQWSAVIFVWIPFIACLVFGYISAYNRSTNINLFRSLIDIVVNVPLIGSAGTGIDAINVNAFIATNGLELAPLMIWFKCGAIVFLLFVGLEVSLIFVLIKYGRRATNEFGTYICFFVSAFFTSRLILWLIQGFGVPFPNVFLPLQGNWQSISIDSFLIITAILVSKKTITDKPSLINLASAPQICGQNVSTEMRKELKHGLSIGLRQYLTAYSRIKQMYSGLISENPQKDMKAIKDKKNSQNLTFEKEALNNDSELLPRKVFLSYSWDDSEHKEWVYQLSLDLSKETGIQTILDQKDLVLGDPIPQFMERSIECSDYVIIICTPNYKNKADRREGGVGYEDSIITGDLYSRNNHRKYIPILARGTWKEAIPTWANGKLGVDMTTPDNYLDGLKKLKSTIVKGKL